MGLLMDTADDESMDFLVIGLKKMPWSEEGEPVRIKMEASYETFSHPEIGGPYRRMLYFGTHYALLDHQDITVDGETFPGYFAYPLGDDDRIPYND